MSGTKRPIPPAVEDVQVEYVKHEDGYDIEEFSGSLTPAQPTKKRTKSNPVKPSPVKSTISSKSSPSQAQDGLSPKGKFAQMIFEAGLKAVNKSEVEAETGLTANQQRELIRKDKGALRRVIIDLISGL